jgi:hypothetical protein
MMAPRTMPGSTISMRARNYSLYITFRSDTKIPIAVGTTIADRPPHRSVRARLRIRLF